MRSEIALESRHPTGREWLATDFDYDLPPNAIAQEPLPNRSSARLLVVRPRSLVVSHDTVGNLCAWLRPGDLLVANNSRVIPARLRGNREGTGGRTELLLLRRVGDERWEALAKPARRLRPGMRIVVPANDGSGQAPMGVEVEALGSDGHVTVRLDREEGVDLAVYGGIPLPPYITAPLADPERYQTVYADAEGSAAAPTAGLHFTLSLIESLRAAGIGWAEVTLHVGLDTFRPVTADRLEEHTIHREWFAVPDETATAIAQTKRAGGRVLAVGTTAARTLEAYGEGFDSARPVGKADMADLFITPGYRWQLVDGLLTNFHLPRSTLLMMVSALAGVDTIKAAYAVALSEGYRFYSFGDAMLILPTEG